MVVHVTITLYVQVVVHGILVWLLGCLLIVQVSLVANAGHGSAGGFGCTTAEVMPRRVVFNSATGDIIG